MMSRRFLLSISLMLVLWAAAEAMPARGFRHVTVNDGLSRNSIYSMMQDSAGMVYIGTWDALHSFDGYKVRELLFTPTPRHPVRTVTALAQGRRGRIYVGTSQGIITYNVATGASAPFAADSVSYVAQMLGDASGRLHVLDTSGRHSVYDMLTDAPLASFQNVQHLVRMPDGSVDSLTGSLIPGVRVAAAMAGSDGELWVSARGGGVYHRAAGSGKFIRLSLPPGAPEINGFARFGRDVVMGSARGLWAYDTTTGTVTLIEPNPSDAAALNDRQVMSLMTDSGGCLWVGTFFGGINLMSPTRGSFGLLDHVNPRLGGHVISAVTSDTDGRIWFGVEDGGLSCYDPHASTVRNYNSRSGLRGQASFVIATDNVQGIYADGDSLYVGMAYGGMDIFSISDGKLLCHYPPVASAPDFPPSVYAFRRGPDGAVYIGTMSGLYRLPARPGVVERVKELPREIIHTLASGPGGNLLVASQGAGVFVYDGRRWTNIRSAGTKMAMSVCQVDSVLYVGTEGNGLFRYDLAAGKMVGVDLGMESRLMVFSILADGPILWLATNRGLMAYDTSTGNATRFTADDGLQSNQFKINSALRLPDAGPMIFGSVNGVNAFRPSDLADRGNAPRAIITGLTVVADTASALCPLYADTVRVAADNRGITLHLASSSFGDVNKNRFMHRLDPIDQEWTQAGPSTSPSVSYTALPEGAYTFRVRTADGSGVYGEERSLMIVAGSPSDGTASVLLYIMGGAAVVLCSAVAARVARRRRKASLRPEAAAVRCCRPDAMGHDDADADFMRKLDEIIDREMSNIDLSVNDLAAMAGVGRSIFFRKVKTATGKTPNDYMRTRRLQRAAELLSRPDARVNQVCYQTGFSSPSYFSRCFTAHFGVTPSDYLSGRSR